MSIEEMCSEICSGRNCSDCPLKIRPGVYHCNDSERYKDEIIAAYNKLFVKIKPEEIMDILEE